MWGSLRLAPIIGKLKNVPDSISAISVLLPLVAVYSTYKRCIVNLLIVNTELMKGH